jgi:hypothetical protein
VPRNAFSILSTASRKLACNEGPMLWSGWQDWANFFPLPFQPFFQLFFLVHRPVDRDELITS